jgi:hypothetical protein
MVIYEMTPASRASRLARRASFWLAAGFALLIAHDATFAVQVGPGQALTRALREAGHGYWGLASALLIAGAAIGAAVWIVRMAVLARRASGSPAGHGSGSSWRQRAAAHWIRLFVLVALAFAVQENAEHFLSHGHVIGVGALIGAEYPLAMPVLALVTGLAAAVIALAREHEAALLARIAAAPARVRPLRRIGPMWPEPVLLPTNRPMAAHRALRAPPLAFLHA